MISYIKGTLQYLTENDVIVEAGGIGYQISVSPVTLSKLPEIESEVKIFTFMSVKEDSVSLFGFLSREELELFQKLITVSGIGPKGALSFLAQMTPTELILAILSEDTATLCKAPGVGKKTAQRLVLELKDKLKNTDFIEQTKLERTADKKAVIPSNAKFDAIEALTALGYSRSEAAKAVSSVYIEGETTEIILKHALKKIAGSL